MFGRPEGKFVFLKTFQEIQSQLINLEGYLRRFIQHYEGSNVAKYYEPLLIRKITDSAEVANLMRKTAEFRKAPGSPHQDFVQAEKSSESVNAMLDRFVASEEPLLLLTGDYGSGKTTVCQRLCYEIARRTLEGETTGRIPIYIPLKYYSQMPSVAGLVQTFLAQEGLRHNWYDAFIAMNDAGLLLLVFDGFDEMARRVTTQIRIETFRELIRICGPHSKVIITGRSGYFPNDDELYKAALQTVGVRSADDLIRRKIRGQIQSESYWTSYGIMRLNNTQIRSFLTRRLATDNSDDGAQAAAQAISHISRTYNLSELARRPILLEMIAETFASHTLVDIANPAQLYSEYVDIWLAIDSDKGDFRTLASPDQRLAFSLFLAWHLFSLGAERIRYTNLQPLVAKFFHLQEMEDVDHFSSDVRTCTFLVRDADGWYRFAHKSFQEYFLARLFVSTTQVTNDLINWEYELEDIKLESLSEAVLSFMSDLLSLPLDRQTWQELTGLVAEIHDHLDWSSLSEEGFMSFAEDFQNGRINLLELRESLDALRTLVGALNNEAKRMASVAPSQAERILLLLR